MRRFLASVLFLFVGLPAVLSALFLVSVRPWALDRETYKRFVEDDRLYTALQAPEMAVRAPDTIELSLQGQGGKAVFDGSSLVKAAQKNLPWPVIKSTASNGVDAILDAIEGKSQPGGFEIDLKPLKAALKAKSAAAARDYEAALAAETKAGSAASGTIQAKPELIAGALAASTAEIPDTLKADPSKLSAPRRAMPIGLLSRGTSLAPGGEALTQALLNRMTATSLAISALLIAGLGALGGTNLVTRLSRAGKYLFIPSLIVLAVGAVLAIPGGLILQNLLPREASVMLEGAGGAQLRDYLAQALGPIARSFFITGLVGASVGGVLSSSKKFSVPKELE
jgi:hypothetical protein